MKNALYLPRVFFVAFLLVWGLYTKAHPGYDMFLFGQKIGSVKNLTQAEDILSVIRHETNNQDIPVSLYLRFFKAPAPTDAVHLLENARQVSGARVWAEDTTETPPAEEIVPVVMESPKDVFTPPLSDAWISSPFGMREGRMHDGVDLAAEFGAPIFACADGTVTFCSTSPGYGNLVILSHENGFESYYAHCSALFVTVGETVLAGKEIAAVGSTGNSTGPHLHFEIRKDGIPEDPLLHISDNYA